MYNMSFSCTHRIVLCFFLSPILNLLKHGQYITKIILSQNVMQHPGKKKRKKKWEGGVRAVEEKSVFVIFCIKVIFRK